MDHPPVSNGIPYPVAQINGHRFVLGELSEFHFLIRNIGQLETGTNYDCILTNSSGEQLNLKIRTRALENDIINCRFNDLTLAAKKTLTSWVHAIANPNGGGDSLNQLTYDQIAEGATGKDSETTATEPQLTKKSFAKSAPVIVFLSIIFLMVAFLGSIFFFAKTKNQIKINHGSLIGNYLPIQATESGIIEECLFKEGEFVKTGDVLFSLGSVEIEEERALAEADLISAKAEVTALEQLISSEKRKFDVAVSNTTQKIQLARVQQAKVTAQVASQQKVISTMEYLTKRRVIYDVGYQKEVSLLKGLISEMQVQETLVKVAIGELDAMIDGEFIIMGENIDDKLNEYRAELGIAQAAVSKAEAQLRVTKNKESRLHVRAPKEGQIFAIYRRPGESIKMADPILSLSTKERSWAFGSVPQNSAHRVRPGQNVRVQIPALDTEVIGAIAAVGHRSVYTEGGWSQDFKVDPLSIPIKIWLPDIPESPPTGIRLKMAITLPFRWPWQEEEKYQPNAVQRQMAIKE